MKYMLLPIGRLLFVLIALFFAPFIYFFEGLLALWHWDKKYIGDVTKCYTDNFVVQPDEVKEGQQYWYYKNPVDYLCRKKSYKIKGAV
jgi:hypothetical protein